MSNSGMAPWVHDFKHRVISWHYDSYMGAESRRALLRDQSNAEANQARMDRRSGVVRSGAFAWQPFVPNVTPFRANSNPFCPITQNQT